MNTLNKVLFLILIVLIMLFLLVPVFPAVNEQGAGREYFDIPAIAINEIGSGYGSDGIDTLDTPHNVIATGIGIIEFPAGSISNSVYDDDYWFIELGNLQISGGTGNSAYAGDGLVWDDPNSEYDVNPGLCIAVTADEVVVDYTGTFTPAGNKLEISNDGIDNRMVNWGTGGATEIDAADVPTIVGNFTKVCTGATDVQAALELIDAVVPAGGFSLDDAYNVGHSVTEDAGAVIWTGSGAGTAWNGRTVLNHINQTGILDSSAPSRFLNTFYLITDNPALNDHFYEIMANSEDSGTTVIEEFLFQLGAIFHVGYDTAGIIVVYDSATNVNHRISGAGGTIFNDRGLPACDFRMESDNEINAFVLDSSEEILSVVGNEFYVGDDDDAASMLLADGSNNYITINTPALSGDWELTLPDNGGLALQFLQTDGNGNTSWAVAAGNPGGADTEIQWNNAGAFGAEDAFTYDDATNTMTLGNNAAGGIAIITNGGGENFSIWYPDLDPGVNRGMGLPTDAPAAGEVLHTNADGTTYWGKDDDHGAIIGGMIQGGASHLYDGIVYQQLTFGGTSGEVIIPIGIKIVSVGLFLSIDNDCPTPAITDNFVFWVLWGTAANFDNYYCPAGYPPPPYPAATGYWHTTSGGAYDFDDVVENFILSPPLSVPAGEILLIWLEHTLTADKALAISVTIGYIADI